MDDLFSLSDNYKQALTKHDPIFFGHTIYGNVAGYECHIDGEDAPLVIVKNDTAYETDAYAVSDLRI